MDTSAHSLSNLFVQLGLAADAASIDRFIGEHRLAADVRVADAPFWTAAQASFLREALEEDSDWAEVVDELEACLH
ncbi:uncharacterized protein DUF2789 [Plasticicumulans lactativorans]|uniref:Uncharacterized protein DUF2789 n=1 Tax=Plasticicumulans lactativorans TaxID=1133106 RepID=A0A4R2LEQ8_9GAMM|nr:DUF2789 domain-containing protein [Plasticicumulans lactativorans]TCO83166.1 uncharacterized protein DUF2789 [Plasticicumulans lactativorans]